MLVHKSSFKTLVLAALVASWALTPLASSPAQAVGTYSASGVEFKFSNSVDILKDSVVGDSYFYEGVATINGTVIDATVSLVAAVKSIKDVEKFYVSADEATALGAGWTQGCYWSEAYATAGNDAALLSPADKLTAAMGIVDAENPDYPNALSSVVNVCGGWNDPQDGYGTIKVQFSTGSAKTPVTLTDLHVSVLDIDGQQAVTFANPKPSSYKTFKPTELQVTETSTSVDFYGALASVDSANQLKWVAETTYDSVSSLEYSFGMRQNSGGGHVDVLFKGTNWSPKKTLANTGNSIPVWAIWAGLLSLGTGLAFTLLGRIRAKA